jgi:hypothetical protein
MAKAPVRLTVGAREIRAPRRPAMPATGEAGARDRGGLRKMGMSA